LREGRRGSEGDKRGDSQSLASMAMAMAM